MEMPQTLLNANVFGSFRGEMKDIQRSLDINPLSLDTLNQNFGEEFNPRSANCFLP